MSESLKIKGRLIKVSDRVVKSEKFTLRIFAIETDGQWPQKIKFQLANDRCDLIDPVQVGEEITVHFDIRGNEWEGKIINNLNAWKIDRSISVGTAPPPTSMPDDDFPTDSDLPF